MSRHGPSYKWYEHLRHFLHRFDVAPYESSGKQAAKEWLRENPNACRDEFMEWLSMEKRQFQNPYIRGEFGSGAIGVWCDREDRKLRKEWTWKG